MFLPADFIRQGYELGIIGLVHVWETGAGGKILASQWMLREEIDVVVDDHQVANLERWIHTPRGIGNKQGLDAQFVHDSHGERNLFHGIALIEMETAFHRHDILATQFAEYQLSGVAFHG